MSSHIERSTRPVVWVAPAVWRAGGSGSPGRRDCPGSATRPGSRGWGVCAVRAARPLIRSGLCRRLL